ncbi:MAG: 50S ribosomal protein L29 [Pseudanabaenaceae cyanobacterium SKYGB_i_bin29]|nr:50S ribosomal protein L29 [Pseudanabaenaceae cyanobacterium SKYG29]MDW8422176.1 50S ribosomal protein L29 [Pseudanabaenaceae cyanobacterium SKYGB_i_bin29]
MALPNIEDARQLEGEALAAEILKVKRELFNLRLRQATRQPVKPHEFTHLKHRLAQLLTVERERQSPAEIVANSRRARRRKRGKLAAASTQGGEHHGS